VIDSGGCRRSRRRPDSRVTYRTRQPMRGALTTAGNSGVACSTGPVDILGAGVIHAYGGVIERPASAAKGKADLDLVVRWLESKRTVESRTRWGQSMQ
jgi:hypothetical protein